jgi:sulfatase modifying factor 1
MVFVPRFCIDRYELSTVDHKSGRPLSPFYPPHPNLLAGVRDAWLFDRHVLGDEAARAMPLPELPSWQREGGFQPRAVSRAGVVPQGYLTQLLAQRACANAGKRLCSKEEWVKACKGERATKYPYGDKYRALACNVFRQVHPAYVLHGSASLGHRDPRLNLVSAGNDPLLRLTGATPSCASVWGDDRIYDMVGNIDEWVDAEPASFLGGFYARSTTQGCEAKVSAHPAVYFDYSTGARCCADAK